ncbi:MAG: carbon starvation protein A [Chitinivibrionales bacterium]|nr:carbon starvation protein A [Chitinivibrionales bacterium]
MTAILLAAAALVVLVVGYRLYSPRVERWLGVDLEKPTPAVEINDGRDFVPARHWTVLFGHHFASIAGAAPIIGPVIACLYWGWLPAVLWIVFGGLLFGAVHDFTSLALSLKHKGQSIATVAGSELGRGGRILFSLFLFLTLILIVAVFAASAGNTLATTPRVVVPTFGLILVAMIVGALMYRTPLPTVVSSIVGVVLLFGLIVLGYYVPVELPVENAAKWWTLILLVYGLVASVVPVTVLLQPRDHLAAAVLFLGMLFGFVGLAITHPEIKAPAVVGLASGKGWLWPMLFVNIACGAISGFHSLVSSGTTSKQLPRMRDARPIAYGGMVMESALGVLAVIAVTAGLYWKTMPAGASGAVYQTVFQEGGWIKAFGVGYGEITKGLLQGLGMLVGITMLKTFIMTTLDSATRITRYVCNELFGDMLGIALFKNTYVATAVVGLGAGALALGNWRAVWPVFGSANQLIASLVLIVASAYLLRRGRRCLFVAIPAVAMLITTFGAMVYNLHMFLTADEPKYLLAVITILLMIMALFLVGRSILALRGAKSGEPAEPQPDENDGWPAVGISD